MREMPSIFRNANWGIEFNPNYKERIAVYTSTTEKCCVDAKFNTTAQQICAFFAKLKKGPDVKLCLSLRDPDTRPTDQVLRVLRPNECPLVAHVYHRLRNTEHCFYVLPTDASISPVDTYVPSLDASASLPCFQTQPYCIKNNILYFRTKSRTILSARKLT